jgi:hypothetical protein
MATFILGVAAVMAAVAVRGLVLHNRKARGEYLARRNRKA